MQINMAAYSIYEEDEVFMYDSSGFRCGLVIESANQLDDSLDSDDSDEEVNVEPKVKRGSVRVSWHPSGKEEVIEENKVQLADRSLMPGDVVRRLSSSHSQRGYVVNSNLTCQLYSSSKKKVILNVNSKDVEPFNPWDADTVCSVTMNSWVGHVESVELEITFSLGDGAVFKVSEDEFTDLAGFYPLNDQTKKEEDIIVNDGNVYPSQQFKGCLGPLEDVHWSKTTPRHSSKMAKRFPYRNVVITVEKVEVKEIDVQWLCQGFSKAENSPAASEPPPSTIKKRSISKLKRLDCFLHCSVQMGDKVFYTYRGTETIKDVPANEKKHLMMLLMKDSHKLESIARYTNEMGALLSKGDATQTKNIKNTAGDSSHSKTSVIDKQAVPGEIESNLDGGNKTQDEVEPHGAESLANRVLDNGITSLDNETHDEADDEEEIQDGHGQSPTSSPTMKRKKGKKRHGKVHKKRQDRKDGSRPEMKLFTGLRLPCEVIFTTTQVSVRWQDGSLEENIVSTDLVPIHHLDEHEFFPGDFVSKNEMNYGTGTSVNGSDVYGVVKSMDHNARTCIVHWVHPYEIGKSIQPTMSIMPEEISVYDIKDHTDYKFRSGMTVVRVGGFEGTAMQAAGQVYDLAQDGKIEVAWADGTISACYPQELYAIDDDDMSDFDSDTDSCSSSDDESSDESSEESWQTEEEEEFDVDQSEEIVKSEKESESLTKDVLGALSVKPERKAQLDQLLESARSTLQKLEDTFAQNVDIAPHIIHCYREILHMYRTCKDLDYMLKSKFFEQEELLTTMSEIKKQLKKAKSEKVAKQVLDLFASNCPMKPSAAAKSGGLSKEENKENKIPENIDPSNNESLGATATTESIAPETTPLVISPSTIQAKDLCQNGCRLLNGQVMKVHETLEAQYQMLKEQGMLHVIGEGEVDSEDEVVEEILKQSPSVSALMNKLKTCEGAQELESVVENKSKGEASSRVSSLNSKRSDLGLDLDAAKSTTSFSFDSLPITSPVTPQTPAEVQAKLTCNSDGFQMEAQAPETHKFFTADHEPVDAKSFFQALKKELKMLRTSLPMGITVKSYENRMDLFSIMIKGPTKTPYEDGLFFFEVQLPNDYPTSPPRVHYISFCSDRLNPNLYEDGKVCVSLLGTWSGKGTEVWSSKSSLLQVLISIQGLILVNEPYYNEAGYEKQKGTDTGHDNSRKYNEMAICKMVQSMTSIITRPPKDFELEVVDHLRNTHSRFVDRLEGYIEASNIASSQPNKTSSSSSQSAINLNQHSDELPLCQACPESQTKDVKLNEAKHSRCEPEFPLLPGSRGFCLTLRKCIDSFLAAAKNSGVDSNEI